ncbi:MAG TPA: type II secretion system minor pseudopilin GspK [Steroidobacteraceae bacterium]
MSTTRQRARRRRPCNPPRGQRGIALLVAILLVALGTIIAAAVAYENATTMRRGAATYAFDEALLIEQGAEALAAYGLRQIAQTDSTHTYPGQGWEKPVGPFEVVPGVMLEASLEDLQGRFNLNSLVKDDGTPDPIEVDAFRQLLARLGLETKWAGYLIDWIDADTMPSNPDGAEDSVYMGQTLPYRTANRYITSTSELLALPGFGRDRYVKLAPFVTALPSGTKLNVCSAPGEVLDAFLGSGHSEFGAEPGGIAKSREGTKGCFPTLSNYQAAFDPRVWAAGASQKFQQNSSYFRLTSFITIGSAEFNLYSLLYQDTGQGGQGGSGSVRAIQRSFTSD